MRILTYLAFAALLAGCVSPAERAALMQREVDEMMTTYGPACERLGYKSDSDPWRECVLRLATKESYERYRNYPSTTNCFGHRGFFQCSTF
jgi:hypothetical protein